MTMFHLANTQPSTNSVVDRLVAQSLSTPTSPVATSIVAWYLKTASASTSR